MPRKPFVLGDLRAGRKKGSRNRLGRDFFQALSEDFAEHGAGVIKIVRFEEPATYLKIVASVMPKDLMIEATGPLTELSDEDLTALLEHVRQGARRLSTCR